MFLQSSLPTSEGIAAWAAAAGEAGAIMPGRVAEVLSRNWEEHGIKLVDDVDDLFDAFDILEAVAAAARSIYRNNEGRFMPRGMEVGIRPDRTVSLVWQSDSHTTTLFIGSGGWSTADLPTHGAVHWEPDMSTSMLIIEGEELEESPRVLAAVTASPTLQAQGWQ